MKIGFILYPGFTLLDFAGVYDPLTRLKQLSYLPELSWDLCCQTETLTDGEGLQITGTAVNQSLQDYQLIVVPGARNEFFEPLLTDDSFLQWLQTAKNVPLIASVCTGSLLLGAAGLLIGHTATTHPEELEQLKSYCRQVSTERVVHSKHVITAGGVTAGIDLGLALCQRLVSEQARNEIAKLMDYHS